MRLYTLKEKNLLPFIVDPFLEGSCKDMKMCWHMAASSEALRPTSGRLIGATGWMGEAKVSCILRHRGVQLILVYSWARPAIFAAGKGRGEMFLFLVSSLSFIFLFLPCPSLSSPLLSLFSLSLGDDRKWPTRVDVSLNPNTNKFNRRNSHLITNFLFTLKFGSLSLLIRRPP